MPLTKVETLYQLPDGKKVNEKTLTNMIESGEAKYGLYSSYTPGIGSMLSLSCPSVASGMSDVDTEQLVFIIDIINRKDFSDQSRQQIQECFEKSIFLRFHMIDLLLPRSFYVPANLLHYKLTVLSPTEQKYLFSLLIETGAYYEHLIIHPSFNEKDLENFIRLFGHEFLNKKVLNQYPLATTFFMGRQKKAQVTDGLKKLKLAIENGADIHQSHQEHGNLVHSIIANEQSYIADIIEELEKARKNNKFSFNYTLQDGEGKTPLFLAIKVNHQRAIQALFRLVQQNIDIGINIPDQQGRTPLLIAAALGNVEAVKLLLDNGADLHAVDKEGRDIHFYINANEALIRSILLSIHVEPDRDVNAPYNWIPFTDDFGTPLASDKSTETHHRVLISQKENHFNLIKEVLREALLTNPILASSIQVTLKYLKKEQKTTVLEHCLEKQRATQIQIYNYQLFEACALGDLNQVKELIAKGANVNAIDGLNRTALHYAVMRQEMVQAILTYSGSKRTIEQCMLGHIEVFDFLLKQKVDLNIQNKNGNTVLALIRNMSDQSLPKKLSELDIKIAKELAFIVTRDVKLSEAKADFSMFKQMQQNLNEVNLSNSSSSLSSDITQKTTQTYEKK